MSAPTLADKAPIAPASRTFARAIQGSARGSRPSKLWFHLGWQDIKQRYRRSILGPFWITIATGTTAVAMGILYSSLFNLDVAEFLPYVTLGFIVWNMISGAILEGAEVFISNEGLIQTATHAVERSRVSAGLAPVDSLRPQLRDLHRHFDRVPETAFLDGSFVHSCFGVDRDQRSVGFPWFSGHPLHSVP